jgi:hypothetical protein
MKVDDLFILHQGNGFELINMDIDNLSEINFVARTSENNGVVAKIKIINNTSPFPAGYITVALGGSVLSSFVQKKSFYTGFHVMALQPKTEMSLEEKLFYCHCIKMNAYRYRYGRQANKTLKDIEFPALPDWLKLYTIDYSRITTVKQWTDVPLHLENWQKFKMDDLFNFKKGVRLIKEHMVAGNTNFLAAIDDNNGIRNKIDAKPEHQGNCLTVNYNGSVGEAFYQNKPFCASDDVNILYPKDWTLNKNIGLFLITIIRFNKYRFGYGRKWTLDKMKGTYLSLPVDKNGNPDWQFMENYIKALLNSDKI